MTDHLDTAIAARKSYASFAKNKIFLRQDKQAMRCPQYDDEPQGTGRGETTWPF